MRKELLLFLVLICAIQEHSTAPVSAILSKILNLSESEYFSADPSALSPRESQLLGMNFVGVAVNAPSQIDTERHDRLPLVMAVRCGGERDWDLTLRDNCILLASNLQDGTVALAPAFATDKTPSVEPGTKKGPRPAGLAEVAAQLTELDVRRLIDLDWNSGTWALGVIYYDWPSNIALVELKGRKPLRPAQSRPVYPAPDPATGTRETASRNGCAALPCYFPTPRTPAARASGTSFLLEYRAEHGRKSLNVFGTFEIRTRPFHLPGRRIIHRFQNGRKETVGAAVPVTLAVLSANATVPLQFDWVVPIYGRQPKVGTAARGFLAVDALATGNRTGELDPGRYVAYLIVDGRISGPQAFEVPGEPGGVGQAPPR